MLPPILSSFLSSLFHLRSNLHLRSYGSRSLFLLPRHKEISSWPHILTSHVSLESYKLLTPPAAADTVAWWWAEAARKNFRLLLQMEMPDTTDALGPFVKGGPSRCKSYSTDSHHWSSWVPRVIFWNVWTSAAGFRRTLEMICPIKTDNPSTLKWKIIMLLPIYSDPRENGPIKGDDFKV